MRLLQLAEQDGVSIGSELYFMAAELFRTPARRAELHGSDGLGTMLRGDNDPCLEFLLLLQDM